ncbi:MAG TPA: hypothetical protein VJ937_00860 [Salinivirga sp.]|uniref:hypothetical protein n=1 Tax=Salinivirga sp. TaxID=1970192 RepID=UPI002B48D777|nr:hypothetical protein [Salinivirga sp.]HKK58000.1 hypothetical protein [Salinivirga sp.]
MSESSRRPFKELITELIALYHQLRKEGDFDHPDIEIDGNVDFLLNHFDSIRDNMDEETFENMGEPVRDLLENLLTELRREVKNRPDTPQEKQPETQTEESPLDSIDKKLQQKDLTTEEINKLLDQRSKLA